MMFDDSWMNSVPRVSSSADHIGRSDDVLQRRRYQRVIYRIGQRFHHAEMAFDVINTWTARNYKWHPDVKKYNAPFDGEQTTYMRWKTGIRDYVIKEYLYMDRLKTMASVLQVMLPLFPSLREIVNLIVHMKFQQQSSK